MESLIGPPFECHATRKPGNSNVIRNLCWIFFILENDVVKWIPRIVFLKRINWASHVGPYESCCIDFVFLNFPGRIISQVILLHSKKVLDSEWGVGWRRLILFFKSKLIRCYSGLAAPHSIGRGNLGTRVMFGNSPPVAHDHPCKRSVIHPSTIGKPQNTLTSFERPWHFYQAITNHTCARRLIVQSKFNDLSGRIVERRVNILFWNRKSYPSILVKCKFNRLIYTSRLEPTKHLLSENSTKRTEAHDYSNIPYEKEALVFRTKATSQRNNCLYSFALGVFANYTPLGEYGYRKHFTAC